MNNENVLNSATAAIAVGVIGTAIVILVHTQKKEAAKRREIEKNMKLDIAAIRRASKRTVERIKNGEFDDFNLDRLFAEARIESEFQMIAIREEV